MNKDENIDWCVLAFMAAVCFAVAIVVGTALGLVVLVWRLALGW